MLTPISSCNTGCNGSIVSSESLICAFCRPYIGVPRSSRADDQTRRRQRADNVVEIVQGLEAPTGATRRLVFIAIILMTLTMFVMNSRSNVILWSAFLSSDAERRPFLDFSVQSAFHRFDRTAASDNGFARGLISKLLGRSIFRRNSKYVTGKNIAPTPATIGPPGLSPRPNELYIDCTAAKTSATPSPKQIVAETYFTTVMMLPLQRCLPRGITCQIPRAAAILIFADQNAQMLILN
jgi:hypothetical protein